MTELEKGTLLRCQRYDVPMNYVDVVYVDDTEVDGKIVVQLHDDDRTFDVVDRDDYKKEDSKLPIHKVGFKSKVNLPDKGFFTSFGSDTIDDEILREAYDNVIREIPKAFDKGRHSYAAWEPDDRVQHRVKTIDDERTMTIEVWAEWWPPKDDNGDDNNDS